MVVFVSRFKFQSRCGGLLICSGIEGESIPTDLQYLNTTLRISISWAWLVTA